MSASAFPEGAAPKAPGQHSATDLLKRTRAVLPSWLAIYYDEPIEIERGEGRHVWTPDGTRYLLFEKGQRDIVLFTVSAILLLDILSITFYRRYAYLAVLGVAAGLLIHAFLAMPPQSAGTQNNIIVALLLLMFAILPTEATLPPPSWRQFDTKQWS